MTMANLPSKGRARLVAPTLVERIRKAPVGLDMMVDDSCGIDFYVT